MSGSKSIDSFSIVAPQCAAVIDQVANTIEATLPFGTDLSSLVAEFSYTGITVKVDGVIQTSEVTANDFSAPLPYIVSAADGSVRTYAATITAALESDKVLTGFSFQDPPAAGTIDQDTHIVTVSVPATEDVTSLVASFVFIGASVTVDGTDQESGTTANDFSSPLIYQVHAPDGSTQDYTVVVSPALSAEEAYVKASNTGSADVFGTCVALDGDTLVVSAAGEDSSATTVNGNEFDNAAPDSGAVYVYVRSGATWSKQAYLKASNADAGDGFGYSVAVSGNTIVVGAFQEDSAGTGVNGAGQADDGANGAGAAYVFVRDGAIWSQQAYLKASNTDAGDWFGFSVAIAGDTIAVGAPYEDSPAVGIDGDQSNDLLQGLSFDSGAAYVFVRTGTTWSQEEYIKASNTDGADRFGTSIAESGDTIAVGAVNEGSAATGVDGDQNDDSASGAGAVYVYTRSATDWTQEEYVKASNTDAGDSFGCSLALSGDALVVGARQEDSETIGVDGDDTNNLAPDSGAAYVFLRTAGSWAQESYLKASNTDSDDSFGAAVSIDGDLITVCAYQEDGAGTGLLSDDGDDAALNAGAAYLFREIGSGWRQITYIKASNAQADDSFGSSAAVSGDLVAVSATGEDSSSNVVGTGQSNNAASSAGAAYLYR